MIGLLIIPIALFQSTCPARGTTVDLTMLVIGQIISIHVPREGHDFDDDLPTVAQVIFQSTCPARGTTVLFLLILLLLPISIHVPREGHDNGPCVHVALATISIHVPREGHDDSSSFFETLGSISIHVPREGHDRRISPTSRQTRHFNPRAPRGARQQTCTFFRADLRKSYKYPAERDALPTKNVCKHIKTLG